MSLTTALWFRKTLLSAAAVVLIGLAALATIRLSGAVGLGEEDNAFDFTDLRATDFEMPAIPDDENAAAWLKAGAAAIVWSEAEKETIGTASRAPSETWSKDLLTDVRETLDRHRGALETLHRAAALERSSYGIRYSQGVHAEVPDLLSLLDANRLLMAETRVALADGDEGRTLAAVASMSRLASSLANEHTLITALVSIACERMKLVVMGEVVGSDQPLVADARFLGKIDAVVSGFDGQEMIGRVFDAWTAVMELHLNNKASAPMGEYSEPQETIGDVTRQQVDDAKSELLAMLRSPYGKNPEGLSQPGSSSLFQPHRKEVAEDMKGFQKAIARMQSIEAQRQLVGAAIALRRVGISEGTYPAVRPDLRQLASPDPFTGRPIVYDPQPDGGVVIELDGAAALAEQIVTKAAAGTLVPITLPPPRR
jgi:hypothetical protein